MLSLIVTLLLFTASPSQADNGCTLRCMYAGYDNASCLNLCGQSGNTAPVVTLTPSYPSGPSPVTIPRYSPSPYPGYQPSPRPGCSVQYDPLAGQVVCR